MKNRGISLIELIITISIMSIMIGGVVLTFSIVNSANTNKCAEQINTLLEKEKVQHMSNAQDYSLIIYYYSDPNEKGYYAKVTKNTELASAITTPGIRLGSNRISIYYHVTGDTTDRQVTSTGSLVISFHKSSGAFSEFSTDKYVESISIKGSKNGSKVILVTTTGKHYVE